MIDRDERKKGAMNKVNSSLLKTGALSTVTPTDWFRWQWRRIHGSSQQPLRCFRVYIAITRNKLCSVFCRNDGSPSTRQNRRCLVVKGATWQQRSPRRTRGALWPVSDDSSSSTWLARLIVVICRYTSISIAIITTSTSLQWQQQQQSQPILPLTGTLWGFPNEWRSSAALPPLLAPSLAASLKLTQSDCHNVFR